MRTWMPWVLWSLAVAAPAADRIEIVSASTARGGVVSTELTDKLVRLLEHCSVELRPSMSGVSPLYFDWASGLALPNYIRLTLAPARTVTVSNRSIEIHELLLPMPAGAWPGPLMVRHGEQARAFTKYSPVDIEAVRSDPEVAKAFPPSRDAEARRERERRELEEAERRCAESREPVTTRRPDPEELATRCSARPVGS